MDRKSFIRRSSRIAQQLGIGSIAVGIIAALAKAWATYWLGPSTTTPPEPVAVVVPEKVAPTTVEDLLKRSPITLAEWQSRVEQHFVTTPSGERRALSAEERERKFRDHLGKEMIWEGFIDQVNPSPEKDGSAIVILRESYASLHSDAPLGPPFIRCWCLPAESSRLFKLERGNWAVVRGRLKNPTLLGSLLCTDLEECRLVTSGSVRNVEMALEASSDSVRR